MEPNERPDFVTDEHLDYLDSLRETGIVNMFGAGEYVSRHFGLDRKQARDVLTYWMRSYADRHPFRQIEAE